MSLCRCHGFRPGIRGSMPRRMSRRSPWWRTCWRTTQVAAPSLPCCTSTAHRPSGWKVGAQTQTSVCARISYSLNCTNVIKQEILSGRKRMNCCDSFKMPCLHYVKRETLKCLRDEIGKLIFDHSFVFIQQQCLYLWGCDCKKKKTTKHI